MSKQYNIGVTSGFTVGVHSTHGSVSVVNELHFLLVNKLALNVFAFAFALFALPCCYDVFSNVEMSMPLMPLRSTFSVLPRRISKLHFHTSSRYLMVVSSSFSMAIDLYPRRRSVYYDSYAYQHNDDSL